MQFYCSEQMQNRELNTCKQDIYSFLHFSLPTNTEPCGSGGSNDDIPIDGLYFNRNGFVSSKPIKSTDFDSNGKTGTETIYVYDNQGRVQQYTFQSSDYKIVYTYKYSGKKVISTRTTTYYNIPNANSTIQTVTEYY